MSSVFYRLWVEVSQSHRLILWEDKVPELLFPQSLTEHFYVRPGQALGWHSSVLYTVV